MKSSIPSVAVLAALAMTGATSAANVDAALPDLAAARVQEGWGSATVTVYHSETGEALAGIPVTVRQVVMPDVPPPTETGQKMVVFTNEMGNAEFSRLAEGLYIAYISYNNIVTEPVGFWVIADYHPFVRLEFNPDID